MRKQTEGGRWKMNRTFMYAQNFHKLRKKTLSFLLFMSPRLVQLKQRVKELNIPQEFKSLHINTVVTTDCKRTETQ